MSEHVGVFSLYNLGRTYSAFGCYLAPSNKCEIKILSSYVGEIVEKHKHFKGISSTNWD